MLQILQMTNSSSQVDKGTAETGVKGLTGRALRPWLPNLQVAWHPHGGHGGNHMEGEPGPKLADLRWSVTSGIDRKAFTWEENWPIAWSMVKLWESFQQQKMGYWYTNVAVPFHWNFFVLWLQITTVPSDDDNDDEIKQQQKQSG